MPRIDRRDDRLLDVLADDGRGIGRQRGHADGRLAGGERDAARSGQPDPQAGETAGAGGDRDAVERRKRRCRRRVITRAISGISASAWPRFMACDSCAISSLVSVSSTRSGAGIERGIDGEDQHREPVSGKLANSERKVSHLAVSRRSPLAMHYCATPHHIGRTSTTSGTKCFSRFWMPCCKRRGR